MDYETSELVSSSDPGSGENNSAGWCDCGYRICGGLIIASRRLWETIVEVSTQTAVVGERGQKQHMVMSTQTEELEIHPCPKDSCLDCSQQESKHTEARGG